jgi:hypothetical protein
VTEAPVGIDTSAWYVLVNRKSGEALDVYNLATDDGVRITQWSRNNQAQQQWQFVDSDGGHIRLPSLLPAVVVLVQLRCVRVAQRAQAAVGWDAGGEAVATEHVEVAVLERGQLRRRGGGPSGRSWRGGR